MLSLSGANTASILFSLNAAIWLVLSIFSLARISDSAITPILIAVLMIVNAGAMLLVGWGIARRVRLAYPSGLGLLVINILLTFTDQFGVLDLITLLVDLALLGLLVATRRQYTRALRAMFSKPDGQLSTNSHESPPPQGER